MLITGSQLFVLMLPVAIVTALLLTSVKRVAAGRALLLRTRRPTWPNGVLRRMRRVLTSPGNDTPARKLLADTCTELTELLLRFRADLRSMPRLPAPASVLCLQDAAERLAYSDTPLSSDVLAEALSGFPPEQLSTHERNTFPLVVSAAMVHRLDSILRAIICDERACRRIPAIISGLKRARRPLARLLTLRLSPEVLAALIQRVQEDGSGKLSAALDEWLSQHSMTPADVIRSRTGQQLAAARDLQHALDSLRLLSRLSWPVAAESCDPLHHQLLHDPAGLYPRMTLPSRRALRLQIERTARRLHTSPAAVAGAALHLSANEEEGAPSAHAGFWVTKPSGLAALRRALHIRRGMLWLLALRFPVQLNRAILWLFSAAVTLPFLNAGHPIVLLPAFYVVSGVVVRAILRMLQQPVVSPALETDTTDEALRTLVIMHVCIEDSSSAIAALRRLWIACHGFSGCAADCLLVADPPPRITMRSGNDPELQSALAQGIAALQAEPHGDRMMYLLRGRSWSDAEQRYTARGGRAGAVDMICRLIAYGQHGDEIASASFQPASLYRRYSFVLVLEPHTHPLPGMLEALLATASHPLSMRYPSPEGHYGFSCFKPKISPAGNDPGTGACLIRPDAYLEAVDGIVSPSESQPLIASDLAGACTVPDAIAVSDAQESPEASVHRTTRLWQTARWLFPWVSTASGVIRNPLSAAGALRLREHFRSSLIPICQCIILIYALLAHELPLLLTALLLPSVFSSGRRGGRIFPELLRSCILLPFRAACVGHGICNAISSMFRRGSAVDRTSIPASHLLRWSQGIAAATCILLPLLSRIFWLPSVPAALFFASGLRLPHSEPRQPNKADMSQGDRQDLSVTASATWSHLRLQADQSPLHVPADFVQEYPKVTTVAHYSLESFAWYFCSIIAAQSLMLIASEEAALRMEAAAESLQCLPRQGTLPYQAYTAQGVPVDQLVNARACGLLIVSLTAAAQALRTWLPELPPRLHALAERLDSYADSIDLRCLYDADAGLFYELLESSSAGRGYCSFWADESLLLSMAASVRGDVPPDHFTRLSRTHTEAGGMSIPLSVHGDVAAQVLPSLFLPGANPSAADAIRLMQQRGVHGLWARSRCADHAFTPHLEYRVRQFGLPEIAGRKTDGRPVFAPYAAALTLTTAPQAALSCLRAMRKLGAFGPEGYCDSISLSEDGRAELSLTRNAPHQGMILCACAHILADAPLRRFYCAIPSVSAALPALRLVHAPHLTLPPKPVMPDAVVARQHAAPPELIPSAGHEAQLLGSRDAQIIINASGSSRMQLGGRSVTDFQGFPSLTEGLQIYAAVQGEAFRLTDPALPGETRFSPARVTFTRVIGTLKTRLTIFADLTESRLLHLVELNNLSTEDASVQLADCMLTRAFAPTDMAEASSPAPEHLILKDRSSSICIHHQFISSVPIERSSVCTSACGFLGTGGDLFKPMALSKPMADVFPSGNADCLSFRIGLTLGGRGQASVLFSTSLHETLLPDWQALDGLIRLSALQAEAIAEAYDISGEAAALADRIAPFLVWHGLIEQIRYPDADPYLLYSPETGHGTLLALDAENEDHLDQLGDCIGAALSLSMRGIALDVCILCTEGLGEAVRCICSRHTRGNVFFPRIIEGPSEQIRKAVLNTSDVHLTCGSQPFAEQLAAVCAPAPTVRTLPKPDGGLLPKLSLENETGYGGFDPATGDYIVQLEAGQLPPSLWSASLHSSGFSFEASVLGLGRPMNERMLLTLDGQPPFDPMRAALPMTIRFKPGVVHWQVYLAACRIELKASLIPGHPGALRTLRIVNLTGAPLHVNARLHVAVAGSPSEGLILTDGFIRSDAAVFGFAAPCMQGWRMSLVPSLLLPDYPCLSTHAGLLEINLRIRPGGSADASWLVGRTNAADRIGAMQGVIADKGSSNVFRRQIEACSAHCSEITVNTPEPTLDILFNHLLPRQILGGDSSASLPDVKLITEPAAVSEELRLRFEQTTDPLAKLLACCAYGIALRDGMNGLPDTACLDTIRSLAASADEFHDPLRLFIAAVAAGIFSEWDQHLRAIRQTLLNHADVHLWQKDHYGAGDALALDVQCWAAFATGRTFRTERSLISCRETLYAPQAGLIRHQLPDPDAALLPGTHHNGGQDTQRAVWYAAALLHTGEHALAWEILRALNPLHHTDTLMRTETFRAAPWVLPESMEASPAASGRAGSTPGNAAAECLHAVLLRMAFGFRRSGDTLLLHPCVPDDWDGFSAALRLGESTWHFEFTRGLDTRYLDGRELHESEPIPLNDDGRIHQVRIPL